MCSLLENTVFCCGMGPFLGSSPHLILVAKSRKETGTHPLTYEGWSICCSLKRRPPMSLKPSPIPPVPGVTACVAHAAFPHGNVVMQLRDALGTIYTDEVFADFFPTHGQ